MRSREASQLEGGRKNQSSLHLHPTYMEPQSIHTYADASFTIDDISAPWTGGEEILEIIWVEKYNDPSVQRRQLIDEEPSNSSFAIERAIDRNRAFAILFINVLLSFLGYIARNRRILISVLSKSSFDSRSGIFGARTQKGERKK